MGCFNFPDSIAGPSPPLPYGSGQKNISAPLVFQFTLPESYSISSVEFATQQPKSESPSQSAASSIFGSPPPPTTPVPLPLVFLSLSHTHTFSFLLLLSITLTHFTAFMILMFWPVVSYNLRRRTQEPDTTRSRFSRMLFVLSVVLIIRLTFYSLCRQCPTCSKPLGRTSNKCVKCEKNFHKGCAIVRVSPSRIIHLLIAVMQIRPELDLSFCSASSRKTRRNRYTSVPPANSLSQTPHSVPHIFQELHVYCALNIS